MRRIIRYLGKNSAAVVCGRKRVAINTGQGAGLYVKVHDKSDGGGELSTMPNRLLIAFRSDT